MDAFRYVHDVWMLWVSLFPANDIFGSKVNTAACSAIALIGVIGWIIGKTFGKDAGVR